MVDNNRWFNGHFLVTSKLSYMLAGLQELRTGQNQFSHISLNICTPKNSQRELNNVTRLGVFNLVGRDLIFWSGPDTYTYWNLNGD